MSPLDEADDAGLRTLPGWLTGPTTVFAVALVLVHIYWNTFGIVSDLWKAAIHFGGFGLLTAFYLAPRRRWQDGGPRALIAVDVALGILVLVASLSIALAERAVYERGTAFAWSDWVATLFCLVMVLELARRVAGLIIPIIVLVALAYMLFLGQYIEGLLHWPGWPLDNTLFRLFYSVDEGMFGSVAVISATSVFMFIVFGAFLVRSGASDFVVDFARIAVGRLVGGPGFVAVFSSGLMGTISGSAIANTAATGVITIPLMKRTGFPAKFAAGVEAAASTGGQLMPPIMGAGAFIMANYTQIPYGHIVAVSVLPALLYFLSVGFYVRSAARKHDLKPDLGLRPAFGRLLLERGAVFILPVATLIGLLVYGYTPNNAAGIAIAVVIAASWLSREPMGAAKIVQALELGAKGMVRLAPLLVAVGGLTMVIQSTGAGNTISLMMVQWAGGNLLIALILIALASLVLGMGLPVVAAYVVLATLAAPALRDLITQAELIKLVMAGSAPGTLQAGLMLTAPDLLSVLGQPMSAAQAAQVVAAIPPELYGSVVDESMSLAQVTAALLAGHMIIFWLSQDSNVTPPVCLAAFTAATIAKTPPMATGFAAWRIAKGLYVVPLLFAYQPFLSGNWDDALLVFGLGLVAVYASVGALEGWLEYRLNPVERILAGTLAVALIWPLPLWLHGIGIGAFALFFASHLVRGRLAARRSAP
ncbi:MAG: TRAP transporter fused permease subunit [Alphaproteobacteria bacterium]